MAINNNILAQKLARPKRQPRPGPIVSEDGATHYRVFDEPVSDIQLPTKDAPVDKSLETNISISDHSEPNQIRDEQIHSLDNPIVLIAHNPPAPETKSYSESTPVDINLNKGPTYLEAELNISGVAFEVINHLLGTVQDPNTGITAPIVFQDLLNLTSASKDNLRKTIQRLEKRGIIAREKFKGGTGGWTQYRICNFLHLQEILRLNHKN